MITPALTSLCLALALLVPLVAAATELTLRGRALRLAAPLALTAVLGSGLLLAQAWSSAYGQAAVASYLPTLVGPGWRLAWRLDGLALPFVVNLLLVTVLAFWYGQDYVPVGAQPHAYYALMLLFFDGMLGGLLADDLVLLLVAWEVMLLASAALLLRWGSGPDVAATTGRYFVYTQAGSLLLMAAFAWLANSCGSTSPQAVAAHIALQGLPGLRAVTIALLLGFGVKMAIVPLHGWLPDAHAIAPMPVTVLLAAMLSLGAYGIIRFIPGMLGAQALAAVQTPLLIVALASQVYGALMSLASRDIKRIVAYSSVSQMGYVLFGVAALSMLGLTGSVLHLINHGVIKALLFMTIGLVIHRTGRRQIDALGGLAAKLPWTMAALALGGAAIAGIPPLLAFHSEWRILAAGLASGRPLLGVVAFGAPLLTIAYVLLLVGRLALRAAPERLGVRLAPLSMAASTAVAAGLVLLMSLLSGPLGRWVASLLPNPMGGPL